MNSVWTKPVRLGLGLCLLVALFTAPAIVASQATSSNSQATSAGDKSTSAKSPASTPSAADIAVAKASGKVWVNLDSGIYHKGGRWYGKTKNGKFVTPEEAKKAGYKAAKRD